MAKEDANDYVLAASKKMVSKRVSSLLHGFLSGLMLGPVLATFFLGEYLWKFISASTFAIATLTVLLATSVTVLVWGLYSAMALEKAENNSDNS